MIDFIIIFGGLMALAGVVLLINPQTLVGIISQGAENVWLHVAAVAVRLVLGVALVTESGLSRFPLAIEIIGWISIVAAVTLAVIGRKKFISLMNWALKVARPFGRIAGVGAIAFGAFLVYCFN